jgi:hypothetical protein
MKYFYSKRVAKSRTLCLLSPRGTQPGTAPGARTSCPLWMPLNHSRAPMNIGRPKRTGCPRAVPLAVTAGAVPGCPPARALERRAVRLACPDRRIASRKKGTRDALPYVSPSPSTRQGCQKVAGGRSGRKGPTTGLTHELQCTSERCQRPPMAWFLTYSEGGVLASLRDANRSSSANRWSFPHAALERHTGYPLPTLPGWAEQGRTKLGFEPRTVQVRGPLA